MSAATIFARLRRSERGTTVIEFAVLMPVMMMMIMGLGELAYQTWAQAILDGAVQKAGRDSAIQGGANSTASIDAKVLGWVKPVAGSASYSSTRKSYQSFSDVKPETFTDTNGNGKRDPGECFEDVNGNGAWDADPGINGQGGANDVTLYKIVVTYTRPFPIWRFIGQTDSQTLTAQTLLKNQPYASQVVATPPVVCT